MTRRNKKLQLALLLLPYTGMSAALAQTAPVSGNGAQASPRTNHAARKPSGKLTERQLMEQMNQKYEALENHVKMQLDEMQAKIDERDRKLQLAQEAVLAAQAQAAKASGDLKVNQAALAEDKQAVTTLQSTVAEIKVNSDAVAQTVQQNQKSTNAVLAKVEHPDTIHFKGVELKPGGFLAGETVYRHRATGGDINTQFTGIPFAGQAAGETSEFNGSGRQSRISLMAEGKFGASTLRGYYEADFLSAAVTSNDNQSNSYTLRQRQVWAQAGLPQGWNITAGQMWSLATENKSGLSNGGEFVPLTIDAQYNAGFSWERQFGFRVTKQINKGMWFATSLEAAQTLNIGGHNLPILLYQQAGNTGGLYNSLANYSYNRFPDVIAKAVYESHHGHYELFGVARFFRDRVYPDICWTNSGSSPISSTSCAKVTTFPTLITAEGAYNSKVDGGGIGANALVTVAKKVDLSAHILVGAGVGRYGSSTLPDVTAKPDGTLEPLKGGSALARVEWHPYKRLDLYGYYGGDYADRAYYLNPAGKLTGFGAPTNVTSGCYTEVAPVASGNGGGSVPGSAASCTADNRNIQEGTGGYWFRFYRGDRGTLQQGFQYSYIVRNTWLGVGGAPKAIDNMWFTSFRYYLPQ